MSNVRFITVTAALALFGSVCAYSIALYNVAAERADAEKMVACSKAGGAYMRNWGVWVCRMPGQP